MFFNISHTIQLFFIFHNTNIPLSTIAIFTKKIENRIQCSNSLRLVSYLVIGMNAAHVSI